MEGDRHAKVERGGLLKEHEWPLVKAGQIPC